MCNLCRILINCLLLISMVSAVRLGRQKREISIFKDLFTSTFYGNEGRTLQIPDGGAEPDCILYTAPDYSDILTQPIETVADEIVSPNKRQKERKPYRSESHTGTKNSAETVKVIQNERNPLSTEILKVPESRMRDTVVPIINGRNAMKFVVEENIIPAPVIFEKIKTNRHRVASFPRRHERMRTVNIEGVKNPQTIPVFPVPVQQVIPEKLARNGRLRILKPVETRYLHRLIERTGPIVRFTPRSYPGVKIRENFITIPKLPKQRIDEAISLADDEYDIVPVIGNHYLYSRKRLIPSESEYYLRNTGKKIVLLNPKPLPLVDTDKYEVAQKHEVENKNLLNLNKNTREKLASDENDKLKPKPYHSSNITTNDNNNNNVNDTKMGKTVSPQKDLNYSKSFNIAKQKDEINTNTPYANGYVSELPVKNITPIVEKTKDKILSKSLVKTGDHLPKSETLAQYINELVRNNKTHPVDLEKFKDELQTNLNTDLKNLTDIDSILDIVSMNMNISNITIPIDFKIKDLAIPKDNVNVTPIVDVILLNNNNNSYTIKPSVIKTKDETAVIKPKDVNLPEEINIRVNHTNSESLSEVEDRDNSQAIVKNSSSSHNSPETINASVVKTKGNVAKSENNNKKVLDKLSTDSQNISSEVSQIITKALNILEEPTNYHQPNNSDIKDLTIPKDDAYITPISSVTINSSNILKPDIKIKTAEIIQKDVTFSQTIHELVNYSNPHLLSEINNSDNLMAIVNNSSSVYNYPDVHNLSAMKTNDSAKFKHSNVNVADKISNNSQNIDYRLRDIISNLLYILEETNEPKTNINTNPTLPNQNISFSHIIENLATVSNDSQKVINDTGFNIASEETKIKTNVVTTSPLSIDYDYMPAITNTPPINYTVDQISEDKEETLNTESTTVTSNIKLPLGDIKNDQVPFKDDSVGAIDVAASVKQNNFDDSSNTVNGNGEKSNNIRETTKSRGDIPDASF